MIKTHNKVTNNYGPYEMVDSREPAQKRYEREREIQKRRKSEVKTNQHHPSECTYTHEIPKKEENGKKWNKKQKEGECNEAE